MLRDEELLEMYRKMVLIRRFEETSYRLYNQGEVLGTIHTSIGQEAVAVGVCRLLTERDYLISTHRGHGHALAKGADPARMMAELLGKKDGYCKGKGGSMHVADFSVGMLGANGIVGAGLPLAVGAALSIQLSGTDSVAVCFFGDGAANQGAFNESLNLAAIWNLPVIFICENNQYAVTMPQSRSTASRSIAERAIAYGVSGELADGMSVWDVYEKAEKAIRRARSGEGPSLIECHTYRFKGHSRGDPDYGLYRSKEEHDQWVKRDPIIKLRTYLERSGVDVEQLEKEVQEEMKQAVSWARRSPDPDVEEALTDVYAEGRSL